MMMMKVKILTLNYCISQYHISFYREEGIYTVDDAIKELGELEKMIIN
jgi:hypothetical protein